MVINADDIDRVVIVDQDQPDPTFEERRRKRERRERVKKIRWFKWAVIGVVAAIVIIVILASPIFSVRDIQIEGAVYTSQETIDEATRLIDGDSYFTLDSNGASNILKEDPWVEDVRISKHFPDTVVVEIDERVPVVWYVGEDNKARVVDAEGRIITVLDGWPTDYLQVTGVGPSLAAGAITDVGYRAAAQTVIALPDELRRLVESLELSPGGELSMTLSSGTIVRFGAPTDLQNKLVSVVVLLRRQNPTDIAVIDVSTGEVTVAMR
jgi:cell division protein FtsQ